MNYEANYYAAPGLKNVALPYNEKRADQIIQSICARYGVTWENLVSPSRKREHVFPRQLVMAYLRKHTCMTMLQIGSLFNRDHTTVVHSIVSINNYLETDSLGKRDEILVYY